MQRITKIWRPFYVSQYSHKKPYALAHHMSRNLNCVIRSATYGQENTKYSEQVKARKNYTNNATSDI